jgi:HK97 family phage prohead protease
MERMACGLRELKFAESGDTMSFTGYGAVFGNVDSYGDVIAPGAFAQTLAAHKSAGTMPLMLLEHGGDLPVGVWKSMAEDGTGLLVTGELLPTTKGKDAYIALKAGAVNGLSIGFRPTEFQMRAKPDDPRRTLKSVELVEVSIVGMPANGKARVADVKSGDELKAEITKLSDLGDVLREAAGWSRSQTEAVLSNFQAKADQGEPDVAEIVAALRRNLSILKG